MRRPEADYLGSGIYELRVLRAGHRYRTLYGFHGRDAVLLSAFAKTEGRVPSREIRPVRARLELFTQAPEYHSHAVDTV